MLLSYLAISIRLPEASIVAIAGEDRSRDLEASGKLS